MSDKSAGLEVSNLGVRYGAVVAVENVSFEVVPGQCVGIVGANGAGKTSLLRGIGGLTKASAETRLRFRGQDIEKWTAVNRAKAGLGHVLEHRHIFPALSVHENLDIVPRKPGVDGAAQFDRVLALFPELHASMRKPAGALSGGQQQFLAFGRALMAEPSILLLDEPTTGLAPILVQRIAEVVLALVKEGKGILIVEQALSVVEVTASVVHILSHGKFFATIDPARVSLAEAAHKAYFL